MMKQGAITSSHRNYLIFAFVSIGSFVLVWQIMNALEQKHIPNNWSPNQPLVPKTTFQKCINGKSFKVFQQSRTILLPTEEQSWKTVNSKPKLILLYNKYFKWEYSKDFYYFMPGDLTFKYYRCYYSNCIITRDFSLFDKADAVIIHDSMLNSIKVPPTRKENQIWILFGMEAPNENETVWKDIGKWINWTMTYRSDSDVQVKYGVVCEKNSQTKPVVNKNYKNKTKLAIWVASNCHSQSEREEYVHELSRYIDIDVYGKCGNLTCVPRQSHACFKRFARNYKFYLSFENALCKDYVTEKIFNVLNYDLIPVVLAGEGYTRMLPPNSYIDALTFKQPRSLAAYMKIIGNNATLYRQYFEWKTRYEVHLDPWMCRLCEKLNNVSNSGNKSWKGKLEKWWKDEAQCHSWKTKLNQKKFNKAV